MTSRRLFRLALVAVPLAAGVALVPSEASAIVNVGAEAGIAKRTDTKVGAAVGVHAEVNPILGLYLGPYFFHYSLDFSNTFTVPGGSGTPQGPQFDVYGARARYILDIFGDDFKPYALLGLGYTRATYPGVATAPSGPVNPTVSSNLGNITAADGSFLEVPVGIGIAHQAFKIVQFDLGFTWRPGFHFGGDAYSASSPYTNPTGGWSLTLGLSLDF